MTEIVVLTAADLEAIVAGAVQRALDERREPPPRVECEWLDLASAAALAGYSPGYFRKLRGVPTHRVGRKLRYHRGELEAWIRSRGR